MSAHLRAGEDHGLANAARVDRVFSGDNRLSLPPRRNPMRRSLGRRHVTLALACIVIPAVQAIAQAVTQVSTATPATNASRDPKKVLTLADYGRWNRITQTAISPDGKWMSYAYQPNDGDITLYVKELDGSKVYTIAAGAPPAAAGGGGGGGFGGGGAATPVFPMTRASSVTM